jgi:hypothetical protein
MNAIAINVRIMIRYLKLMAVIFRVICESIPNIPPKKWKSHAELTNGGF